MKRTARRWWVLAAIVLACAGALTQGARRVEAFSQKGIALGFGDVIPIGHEWITRLSLLELLLHTDPLVGNDPDDPRRGWISGKAKNTALDTPEAKQEVKRILDGKIDDPYYQSTYKAVHAAVIGERWVDIGGFNVSNSKISGAFGSVNCFDAAAQEPADIQYDHFMRRYDERGAEGGRTAALASRAKFIQYFVTAATSPPGVVTVWDGGGKSLQTTVDRNYFLFGRAAHLFEDSFSSEHTVRSPERDHFLEKVVQVKSYLCASGAEQHSQSVGFVLDYQSGDVIWKPGTRFDAGWKSYKPSLMKDTALVAIEASKDLWAAFIRVMGHPIEARAKAAEEEAQRLADTWLALDDRWSTWYDDDAHRKGEAFDPRTRYVVAAGEKGFGQTVEACMKGLGVASGKQMDKVNELERGQRICLYNIEPEPGFSDAVDPSLRMPYNWRWKSGVWLSPPDDWKIPSPTVPPEVRVRIRSNDNGKYMTVKEIANDSWIYCKDGIGKPLEWIQVTTAPSEIYFRLATGPLLMSYGGGAKGYLKLYKNANQASYSIKGLSPGVFSILNIHWKTYLWLETSTGEPRNSRAGDPANKNAQWVIEPVQPNGAVSSAL